MGKIGISITKRTTFRGGIQHFSNTYYYESIAPNPTVSQATDLINEIVTTEKKLHSSDVTFVIGRCWSAGGTAQQNQMLAEVNLSGTGSGNVNSNVDRERAVLFQWPAGLDSRGRQVYLRKWYHPCGSTVPKAFTTTELQQTTSFSIADRNALAAVADEITTLGGVGEPWTLSAKSGRSRDGAPTTHPWFEHHQLGDEWRG